MADTIFVTHPNKAQPHLWRLILDKGNLKRMEKKRKIQMYQTLPMTVTEILFVKLGPIPFSAVHSYSDASSFLICVNFNSSFIDTVVLDWSGLKKTIEEIIRGRK